MPVSVNYRVSLQGKEKLVNIEQFAQKSAKTDAK